MSHHNLFLSHSWKYGDAYDGLVTLLNNREDRNFTYSNYSVPKDDPIHNAPNDVLLRAAIRNQMNRCSKIIILAGVYATYSKWINIEIQLAKEMGKKIIAVQPWGSERTSVIVKNNADRIITWNSRSLVNAIKEL
ncbi:TIR domain-containing protein [Acinetobacter baumannii]|uniref:TIR domain-containing protein n=1 Tax=Acinetobacter baumannii TaxID=470 RepID=UPI001BFCEC92|nr:TIR domain-containing protein [Acinetobacter baumannii]MBT8177086.1 TIR domain-containing protein [Acinetobacter baumannii]MDV4328294.1 TIR domain-containing protein [Acinetobacter baumannii]MDV4333261.1 TIR domain-containing protein [Acinetobacter baumannii]MDV7570689.1 TIR domain-containing protein [Acinetobacter baumannii]HEM7111338.1 TIR domain-containing protein [Acinetobacter baumannii]